MEDMYLSGKGSHSDGTLNLLLGKSFGNRVGIVTIKPTSIGVVIDGEVGISTSPSYFFRYNCGLFVLTASEIFCGASSLGGQDRKLLEYLRYTYLW
ncbi:hypothetical protein GQ600_5432 [Phytophthora cactorum]|nr:hypothetical protein GQ600_5432 [Phytophthora cactorum]